MPANISQPNIPYQAILSTQAFPSPIDAGKGGLLGIVDAGELYISSGTAWNPISAISPFQQKLDSNGNLGIYNSAQTEITYLDPNGNFFFVGNNSYPASGTLSYIKADANNNIRINGGGGWIVFRFNGQELIQYLNGKQVVYNGTSTAGLGAVIPFGVTSQKSETQSADSSLFSYTPPSVAGSYLLILRASVSSASSGVVGFTVSYKDANGNSVSAAAVSIFQVGTAGPALTFTTSAASRYYAVIPIDIDNSGTAISVAWVGGGTSLAAKVTVSLVEDA